MSEGLVFRLIGNLVPLALGFGLASYLKRRKPGRKLPIWPILVGALISLPTFAINILRPLAEQRATSTAQVMRIDEPANGLTSADLTPAFAQEAAKFLLEETKKRVPGLEAQATSSVIEKGGKKLAVIRFSDGKVTRLITVIGISGDKIVRVTCGVTNSPNADVNSPECRDALLADFGMTLDD